MSDASFNIVYDGPALKGSTIDVKDLAPALLAFGDALECANSVLNPGSVKVTVRVHASFKSGSFGIDFSVVQALIDQALSLFKQTPIAAAKELLELMGFIPHAVVAGGAGLISVIKWLRGRKIKEVIVLPGGRAKIIVDNDELETELKTIDLLRNFRLRQALETAIAKPLEREGFERVAISDNPKKGFVVVEKSEGHYFVAPSVEDEALDEREATENLQVVSVSFRDDNKWRFSDGSNSFYAAISDAEFLNKVKIGEESFSSGDILSVRLRRRQWLSADTMRSEFEVVKVLDHRRAMAQLKIQFRDDAGEETKPGQ